MRRNTAIERFWAVLTIAGVLSLCAAGAWAGKPEQPGRLSNGKPFSASGFGHQFGRGMVNIACFWLEIPYQVKTKLVENRKNQQFDVFTSTYNFLDGLSTGIVTGLMRGLTGVYEVLFSPFPPYDALMSPPYPPYLNIRAKPVPAPQKQGA